MVCQRDQIVVKYNRRYRRALLNRPSQWESRSSLCLLAFREQSPRSKHAEGSIRYFSLFFLRNEGGCPSPKRLFWSGCRSAQHPSAVRRSAVLPVLFFSLPDAAEESFSPLQRDAFAVEALTPTRYRYGVSRSAADFLPIISFCFIPPSLFLLMAFWGQSSYFTGGHRIFCPLSGLRLDVIRPPP